MRDYDELLTFVRRIASSIEQQSKRLARDSGLSTSRLLVLQAVAANREPSTSGIAKSVIASQATVSEIVDRLVAIGLIERSRSTTDRRVVAVHLTDAGRQRLANAPDPLSAGFLREFRKLEDWERKCC